MKKVIVTDRFKQHLGPEFFSEFTDIEVITAYSNEQALEFHRSQKADLLITTLYGSGMNTVELCSMLREDEGARGVSIIVFCRDNEVERVLAARCRANAVLTIPIDGKLLREAMLRLLRVPPRRTVRSQFSARRNSPADAAIDCIMENISVTGMLFEASTDLRKGEKLFCRLTLPSAPPFVTQAEAEVVRTSREPSSSKTMRYGARFTRLDPVARRAIERVLG